MCLPSRPLDTPLAAWAGAEKRLRPTPSTMLRAGSPKPFRVRTGEKSYLRDTLRWFDSPSLHSRTGLATGFAQGRLSDSRQSRLVGIRTSPVFISLLRDIINRMAVNPNIPRRCPICRRACQPLKVKFAEWTDEDRPSVPVFMGLRTEVDPGTVRREQSQNMAVRAPGNRIVPTLEFEQS